ncbi:hypothetical protein HUT06_05380 [Actinomadura sp. NAK00032]|uniref:hypothetical protein n=1 Tax=Actinomadura sp. NAK00032 TaxID=2742128 RepID=UPI0015920054|nr:hypothetical protein [Actinomadura sp. NAK00032]QKW33533.1 hypothetical protein HUT06_05380 [Actinomadura sp. NAK00032]
MSELDRALGALRERVEAVSSAVSDDTDELTLAGAGQAVEMVTDVLDLVWNIVGTVMERTEQIRELEVTGQPPGSGVELVETALVHLDYGHKGLEVARHLLGTAREDLLRAERG